MLAKTRYVTVVVRLVLDQRGKLIRGELVRASGEIYRSFLGWSGLLRALSDWLRGNEQDEIIAKEDPADVPDQTRRVR